MAETIGSLLKAKGRDLWSIEPQATVYDAIAMMAEKSIGALLVIAGGELIGIVSERDYARKVILQGRSSRDTRVVDIMTAELVTATPEHTIDECMRLMTDYRIRHLPVLVGPRVVGVISIGDLVKSIIAEQAETIEHLHSYITSKY